MKAIYTLILVLMAGTAYGQSNLPACPALDNSEVGIKRTKNWNNCFGTYAHGDGFVYGGAFKNGFPNGQGISTWADGNRYVGEYKDGKSHGQGTYTLANGVKHVGEYKDGKRNGQGTHTFANGDKYYGEYKDDKYNGQGTFIFINGNKYVGEWKDDKFNGQGTFFRADGRIGLGEWANGVPNGRFIEYRADKTIERSGIFSDGKLITSQYVDPSSFTRIPLGNAIKDTSDNLKSAKSITFDVAKLKCEELGFKPETEGFGKCVLQLTK